MRGKIPGCGRGATTRYLSTHFNPRDLVAVTTDRKDLEACRNNAPGVTFVCQHLPKMKFNEAAFDVIISGENIGSFGRERMLREVFRALKPGGHLVCLDILTAVDRSRISEGVNFSDAGKYREALQEIGFQEIQVADVTEPCLHGLRRNLTKFFIPLMVTGEVSPDTFQQVKNYLLPSEALEQTYLMIAAQKSDKVAQELSGKRKIHKIFSRLNYFRQLPDSVENSRKKVD
jgi:ubiquinone/menaquinone biosynthesis C-methylase UbiE